MKTPLIRLFAIVFASFAATMGAAQDMAPVTADADAAPQSVIDRWHADPTAFFDASEVNLRDLEYVARPIVIFADSPNQPAFVEQVRLLQQDLAGLAIRDVIILIDTDPDARSDVRATLRPRGFSLVLIDKDGRVALRKAEPWDVRELSRQIDKMPLRIQEIRDRAAQAQ